MVSSYLVFIDVMMATWSGYHNLGDYFSTDEVFLKSTFNAEYKENAQLLIERNEENWKETWHHL